MEAQLDEINAQLEVLHDKEEGISAGAKVDYQDQMEKLEKQRDQVRERLEELRESSGQAWNDLRSSMEEAVNSLREGINKAGERFREKEGLSQ